MKLTPVCVYRGERATPLTLDKYWLAHGVTHLRVFGMSFGSCFIGMMRCERWVTTIRDYDEEARRAQR